MGYHVYLRHGTSMCWHIKTRLESGPVTGDLTTTVVLLITTLNLLTRHYPLKMYPLYHHHMHVIT